MCAQISPDSSGGCARGALSKDQSHVLFTPKIQQIPSLERIAAAATLRDMIENNVQSWFKPSTGCDADAADEVA